MLKESEKMEMVQLETDLYTVRFVFQHQVFTFLVINRKAVIERH